MGEAQDKALALAELRRRQPDATIESLAEQAGCKRAYASKLLKLGSQLAPAVFLKWRKGWKVGDTQMHVGVEQMLTILDHASATHMRRYDALRESGRAGRGAGGGRRAGG